MRGLRVLLVKGPVGLAGPLEPELAACADVFVETVATVPALAEALGRCCWDAVLAPSGAVLDLEAVTRLVHASHPDVALLTGTESGLTISLRRLRGIYEQSRNELDRTKREMRVRDEQLRHAQKMEVIGTFAGGIAHDFNNIVMSIAGHASLLLRDWPREQTGRADIEEILRSAEQAEAVTRQLLGFARRESHRTSRLQLSDVIRSVDHLLRRSAGPNARLVVRVQDGLAAVQSDSNQLQQVLLNLVLNARDAMPAGGDIRILAESVTLDSPLEAVDGVVPRGTWVRLTVQDSGVGMDDTARRRAFEPFYTTKPPGLGTGLGLAIVHDILSRSGTPLRMLSAPGRGTTFEMFFEPEPGPESELDANYAIERRPTRSGYTEETVHGAESFRASSSGPAS